MSNAVSGRTMYFTAPEEMQIKQTDCPMPGPGEIRCHTIVSMVSIGTEMICFKRDVEPGTSWDEWIQYPFEPGYLCIGEVTDTGEGVTEISVGDTVCSTAPHREWFIDKSELVTPVIDGVSPEQAAWFQANVIVQNGIRETKPVMGETSVVIGLGMLGQLAIRLLSLCGPRRLIAIDPIQKRCELATPGGATDVWAEYADATIDKVMDITDGRGADIVFDITGNAKAFHAAQAMLGKRGRLGLIGDVPYPSRQTMTHDVICKSISIVSAHGAVPPQTGNHYYRWGKREMTDFFLEMVRDKRINVDELITNRIVPEQAPDLYADLLVNRGDYLGIIIDWRKSD